MYGLKGLGTALLVALAAAGAEPAAAQSEAEVLVAAMQDGNKVIYLRHAATNQNQVDTGRLGERLSFPCAPPLSVHGALVRNNTDTASQHEATAEEVDTS